MKTTLRSTKALAGFLALLLALSLALGAPAESGTIFPWLSYTLDVALVTTDPELVAVQNMPKDGTLVLVKLISPDGGIKTEDIKENYNTISFRDGKGDEFTTDSLRYRCVNFDAATGFSDKPEQDAFELLFYLKGRDESALAGAKLVVPGEAQGERIIVPLDNAPREEVAEKPDQQDANETDEQSVSGTPTFLLGGVQYTISALEDVPKYQRPNRMDGKEGHLVVFSYPGLGADAAEANKQLYSGARLRQPNGDLVRAYSNSDNLGNPYELYFGLSDNVLLSNCVFTITGDDGEVEIPLSVLGGADAEAKPQTTAPESTEEPTPEPTAEPTPEPTAEPEAERDANTFAYTVGGETYELALLDVSYDKEEKAMAVEIVLYDHEVTDFIQGKELRMPFGCGIISKKDGFQYVEGFSATISTPTHITFHITTKTFPDLVCFGKLNQKDHAASEEFALVDPENNQFVSTFPLSALLKNEKNPDKILESGQAEEDTPALPEATAEAPAPSEDKNTSDLEREILAVLAQHAKDTTDAWQLAIFNAGVREIEADPKKEGVYNFKLRGFDPGLKALGKFDANSRDTYLAGVLENAQAYELKASLVLKDGAFTERSVKALKGTVQKAAAASQKAFKDKRVLDAIAYDLFYNSFDAKVKKAADLIQPPENLIKWQTARFDQLKRLSAQRWIPFFYGQTKQVLDVKNGPFDMKLNCTSIDYTQLVENAKADAFNVLKFLDYDNRWEGDELEYQYLLALANHAMTMKRAGKETHTISLNVDSTPFYGGEYSELLALYPYEDGLSELQESVSNLPEYAAKEFPKSGWLSGSKGGTQVRIRAPKDSDAYYVQMRSYHNDRLVASGFVQPGKTCTLRVPSGDYYFVLACGSTWYGEEYLFGKDTEISKTAMTEIMGSNYIHTITLKVTEGGNLPIYGADEDDLK